MAAAAKYIPRVDEGIESGAHPVSGPSSGGFNQINKGAGSNHQQTAASQTTAPPNLVNGSNLNSVTPGLPTLEESDKSAPESHQSTVTSRLTVCNCTFSKKRVYLI